MKVGIITWHKEINHGAVLQAYATQSFLEQHGCEVVLLNHDRSEISMDDRFFQKLSRRAKKLSPSKIKTVLKTREWNEEKRAKFEQFRHRYIHQGGYYNEEQDLDVAIIGSDMVFDFYEGYNPYVYGIGVAAPSLISYAACFGYTTTALLDSFEKKTEIAEGLSKLDSIGCRDANTLALVKHLVPGCNPIKNIDPVLLYGFAEERKIWKREGLVDGPYLLVYSYSFNMDKKDEVKAIREAAAKLGCKIVSVGYWHPWCDININADPAEFVILFANASFVITDTFHGTVFSLIFEKQFRTVIRKNSFKVTDLLVDLDGRRFIAGSPSEIAEAPDASVDYANINANLAKLREQSGEYLLRCVTR